MRMSGLESEDSDLCNLVALVCAAAAGRHLERHPEVEETSRAKLVRGQAGERDDKTIIGAVRSVAGLLRPTAAIPIYVDSLEDWHDNSCLGSSTNAHEVERGARYSIRPKSI
jgi:hypothetical protein